MSDLVSIVVPTFNRKPFLGDALQSILDQTYRDWEALIVDDGSTDATSEIVATFMKRDSRIRFVSHPQRRGAQAARNTGIHAAQGDWIAFLDSDDQWLPDSLSVRLEILKKRNVDVVYSDCLVLTPEAVEARLFGVSPANGHVYKRLLRQPGPMFQSLLLSKRSLSEIGYLDESIISFQEWDTAIRLARHCTFAFVTKPTFIYKCQHQATISKDAFRTAAGYEQVLSKHSLSVLRYCGPSCLASHYHTAARLHKEAKDIAGARRCELKAIALWPFGQRIGSRAAARLVKAVFGNSKHPR